MFSKDVQRAARRVEIMIRRTLAKAARPLSSRYVSGPELVVEADCSWVKARPIDCILLSRLRRIFGPTLANPYQHPPRLSFLLIYTYPPPLYNIIFTCFRLSCRLGRRWPVMGEPVLRSWAMIPQVRPRGVCSSYERFVV